MSWLSGEEAVQIFMKHHVPPVTFVETGTHVGTTLDAAQRKEAHAFIESNTVQVWLNGLLEER